MSVRDKEQKKVLATILVLDNWLLSSIERSGFRFKSSRQEWGFSFNEGLIICLSDRKAAFLDFDKDSSRSHRLIK